MAATLHRYLLGEFRHPDRMLAAVARLRADGVPGLDAYTPFPLHGTSEAMGLPKSRLPRFAFVGGVTGAATGYLMQWWMNAVDYPINVGGRPLHSSPQWVPITFELGVLFAAFAIFFGSLGLFGFPRVYHPVFESEEFRRASVGTFWISVDLTDDPSRVDGLRQRLTELGAVHVTVVEGVPT
jgi:hypothetical protein